MATFEYQKHRVVNEKVNVAITVFTPDFLLSFYILRHIRTELIYANPVCLFVSVV